jgi:hypothetical protein
MRRRFLPLIAAAPLLLAGCCFDICCDTCVPPDPCEPCKSPCAVPVAPSAQPAPTSAPAASAAPASQQVVPDAALAK